MYLYTCCFVVIAFLPFPSPRVPQATHHVGLQQEFGGAAAAHDDESEGVLVKRPVGDLGELVCLEQLLGTRAMSGAFSPYTRNHVCNTMLRL